MGALVPLRAVVALRAGGVPLLSLSWWCWYWYLKCLSGCRCGFLRFPFMGLKSKGEPGPWPFMGLKGEPIKRVEFEISTRKHELERRM